MMTVTILGAGAARKRWAFSPLTLPPRISRKSI